MIFLPHYVWAENNKPGTAEVCASLEDQKSEVFKICKMTLLKFYSAEKTRRNTHNTRKPLFSRLESTEKKLFLKIISIFFRKKSHSAENGTLSSPNAFFKPKTFLETKGVHFDQTKIPFHCFLCKIPLNPPNLCRYGPNKIPGRYCLNFLHAAWKHAG